jgi:ribokinase
MSSTQSDMSVDVGRRARIVVLGGINMDLIATTPRLANPGETVIGDTFYTAPGGKGGNQAVAASRMGGRVSMIGRVGTDIFGPILLEELHGYGVDVTGVATDTEHSSGIAVILLNAERQNHIVQILGSNMQCDDGQLAAARRSLDGADVLMLQLEIPHAVSLLAAREAKKLGVTVMWDPAPSSAGFPLESFEVLDVVTPNQTEAEALTGIAVTDMRSAKSATEVLHRMGAPTAVVKLGEDGVYYSGPDGSGHVGSHTVEQLDTVAAGDAFGGAFAVALGEGRGIETAVRAGTAAGALAVTRRGAQEAMPSRDEVTDLMSRG